MQMSMVQFVEHGLNRLVVVRQRFSNAVRETDVIDQVAQALARKTQVPRTFVVDCFSRFFRPAPIWQCGERPLPNAH